MSSSVIYARKFRNLFILDSRDWFNQLKNKYDPQYDLVLTYDFGLKLDIEALGGEVEYVDHLINQEKMQENNFLAYDFFKNWHFDSNRNDIFSYRGVPFGFSFRLDIWNDLLFYIRTRLCIEELTSIKYKNLVVGSQFKIINEILDTINLPFSIVENETLKTSSPRYFFPVQQWMDDKLRTRSWRHKLRDIYTAAHGILGAWADRIFYSKNEKKIFIQEYYPTRALLQKLKKNKAIKLVLVHYSAASGWMKYFTERPIPIWGKPSKYKETSEKLMREFKVRRSSKLITADGLDISEEAYSVIERRINTNLTKTLLALDCIINYLDKNPINLEILIANIGVVTSLVDCVAKSRGIPSYLIINGLLCKEYLDEAKYATHINSYSMSVKEHYFQEMSNVVVLGDPRMDSYSETSSVKRINRDTPTITIGASGHNSIDLNSYLAVEFDFLYDVLTAIQEFKRKGIDLRVIVKVRSNNYRSQYEAFINEYFSELVNKIVDNVPMRELFEQTDFFISIYSQTLFEASCLGIPCLYYKKDTEVSTPPFDGESELVTVNTVAGLVNALDDFRSGSERYDKFLSRSVMEKYIGPLDGLNLERNLAFIYDLIENKNNFGAKDAQVG